MTEQRTKYRAGSEPPDPITMQFTRAEVELLLAVCGYCEDSTAFQGQWRQVGTLATRFENIAKTWGGDRIAGS